MNIKEHTWKKDPYVSYDKDGKKYEWWETSIEHFYCNDEEGKIYAFREDDGEIILTDITRLDPYWTGGHKSLIFAAMKEANKNENPKPKSKSKPKAKEKSVTWEDIEEDLKKSKNNPPAETDPEMLAYFKRQMIGHLNRAGKTKEEIKAQKEIEKKNIIPMRKKKKAKK